MKYRIPPNRITKSFLNLVVRLSLLASLTFTLLTVQPVQAASFVVNTTTDATNGSCATTCTLRDAMTLAPSGSTITFNVSGTISLISSLPAISNSLIIDSAGQSITLDGGNTYEIMTVGTTGNLSLNALTLTKGKANSYGGAIDNEGTLNIASSTFAQNFAPIAGAIYNGNAGILNIANSSFFNDAYPGVSDFGHREQQNREYHQHHIFDICDFGECSIGLQLFRHRSDNAE